MVVSFWRLPDDSMASGNTDIISDSDVAILASPDPHLVLVLCVNNVEHLLGTAVQTLKYYVV